MKTALVVDDDESIRVFVRKALEKRGWIVLEAEDGVDGMARFVLHQPEVLITDISMPRNDGLEMLEVLRLGGYLGNTRVVVISGVLKLSEIEAKMTVSAKLLSKPFGLSELYKAVGDAS